MQVGLGREKRGRGRQVPHPRIEKLSTSGADTVTAGHRLTALFSVLSHTAEDCRLLETIEELFLSVSGDGQPIEAHTTSFRKTRDETNGEKCS